MRSITGCPMRSKYGWMVPFVAITAFHRHIYAEASQETYTDEETGFTITCPVGWERVEPVNPIRGNKVTWSLSGRDIPYMTVNKIRFRGTATPQSLAQAQVISNFQKGRGFRLIERPTDLTINGVPCARIISEYPVADKNRRPFTLRSQSYYFVKALDSTSDGNAAYEVQVSDSADHFPNIGEEAITQSLNTVHFE